mgnify:CR=1 FL=1
MISRAESAGSRGARPVEPRAMPRGAGRGALLAAVLGVAVLVVCRVPSAAATIVPAVISSDQTWTRAGEPYELRSDVTIQAGATVTVRPG